MLGGSITYIKRREFLPPPEVVFPSSLEGNGDFPPDACNGIVDEGRGENGLLLRPSVDQEVQLGFCRRCAEGIQLHFFFNSEG